MIYVTYFFHHKCFQQRSNPEKFMYFSKVAMHFLNIFFLLKHNFTYVQYEQNIPTNYIVHLLLLNKPKKKRTQTKQRK